MICKIAKITAILLLLFAFTGSLAAQESPTEFYMVAVSPDGALLVGVDISGLIRVWDAHTGDVRFDLANQATPLPLALAWSPDSQRIATAGGDPIIRVWCADANPTPQCTPGQLLTQLLGHQDPITALAWSSDNRLASGGQVEAATLRVWDMNTYQQIIKKDVGVVNQLVWHPSATALAQAGEISGAYVLAGDFPSRPHTQNHIGENVPALSIAWNSDGSQLAYGTTEGKIYIVDMPARTVNRVLEANSGKVYALAWNPDDNRLASSSENGTIHIWNLATSQVEANSVSKSHAVTLQIAWSRGGDTLYYPGTNGEIIGLPIGSASAP